MGKVFIVTHGDKFNGFDPMMTPRGFDQVLALVGYLPTEPAEVICGTGRRHLDVANALRLDITCWNALVGRPDSLKENDGIVVMACGAIPRELYDKRGMKEGLLALLNSLPDNTVICAGRPVINDLGGKGESAAIYIWENGVMTKIAAYGDLGAGKGEV